MAPPLKQETALQIINIVARLKQRASFRNILLEANKEGVLAWHRTLRRYLDLLVQAQILKFTTRDVGSVNPQQNYHQTGSKAQLWAGPEALRIHGLNWDLPDKQLHQATGDLEALVRAKTHREGTKQYLLASPEDTIVFMLKTDVAGKTGTAGLVAAFLATRTLDLPYLLRRADKEGVGETVRTLFNKITEAYTSPPGDIEGRLFLEAREKFQRILRGYNSRGVLKLLETRGRGRGGLETVRGLSQAEIVTLATKQLGVAG